ncbi:hypothetical protein F5I97DRAFT_1836435 [Phlebopus sp. FC_14]|nr:hypothetical protein F5I97DRAFT_1836435 [Phlebopus sp. FC_14]
MASDYDDDDDMGTSVGDEDEDSEQDDFDGDEDQLDGDEAGGDAEGDILETQFASMRLAHAPAMNRSQRMCVVCHVRPAYNQGGKSYPTCGLTCAAKYKSGGATPHTTHTTHSGHSGVVTLCVVCGKRPAYNQGGKSYPTCGLTCASTYKSGHFTPLCVVCGVRPAYNQGGKKYPTCGMTCAAKYKGAGSSHSGHGHHGGGHSNANSGRGRGQHGGGHSKSTPLCVICNRRPCYRRGSTVFPTCGLTHLKKLIEGGADPTKCNYCHRRPRFKHYLQCGRTHRDKARVACLMCRSRPKNGKYHFCGNSCRKIAMTMTPLIREVPQDHVTFKMVENKFQSHWRPPKGEAPPQIKKVYKIVESANFLRPYDVHRRKFGNERFRYHGTGRACSLGNAGQTKLCSIPTCPICNILRTSFKVNVAKASGAFGAGIYTTSASNKAFSYSNGGIMLLNKAVLGKVYNVSRFEQVKSCPPGYNSVVFDRMNGQLNETVLYQDDAIRPVFLIMLA